MIEYYIFIFAIPLGILFAKVTHDEKEIFSKNPYFPIILWALAITAATFFSIDKQIAFPLSFMFIMTLIWKNYPLTKNLKRE